MSIAAAEASPASSMSKSLSHEPDDDAEPSCRDGSKLTLRLMLTAGLGFQSAISAWRYDPERRRSYLPKYTFSMT